MNLNSRIFDRIRTKAAAEQVIEPGERCEHPGCNAPGVHRAPMGRDREGQYFSFCLTHVREYNASYNYFAGMTDAAVAHYQKEAVVGHRPTWNMGTGRGGKRRQGACDADSFVDPLGMFNSGLRQPRTATPEAPRYSQPAMKALSTLNLDETAEPPSIKARYKELVKRLHPDANGGDRSCEDKLREIIHAYNYLRSAKLA